MKDAEARAVERAEVVKDLFVFRRMHRIFMDRVREAEEAEIPEELKALPRWSGATAVRGVLELCIYQMEKTLQLYDEEGPEPEEKAPDNVVQLHQEDR